MNAGALTEGAQQALEAGQTQVARRLLTFALSKAPGNLCAGLMLVRLEMEHNNLAAALRILTDLWRETKDAGVGDVMAEVSLALARSAEREASEDRKVLERLAGMLKALHGTNGILVDTLQYDIIGGLAIDALKLIPLYKSGVTERTGKSVVFFSGRSANQALVEMISRELPAFHDQEFPRLMCYTTYDWSKSRYTLNQQYAKEFFGRHADLFEDLVEFTHSTNGGAYCVSGDEESRVLDINEPQIHFSREEEQRGDDFLRNRLRMPDGAWFVCVFARDSAYYGESPGSPNWFRNSDIQTFLPAIDCILDHGGYVVRIGERTCQILNHQDPRFFDYSNSVYREPLLDVYLLAKCRFLLGTPSGLCHLAYVFRTPELMVNAVNVCNIRSADLYIPKKIRDIRTGKLLPFAEFLERYHSYNDTGLFFENGCNQEKMLEIRYEDNSPEEIVAATLEMMDRLQGGHTESDAIGLLRERFRQIWMRWNPAMAQTPIASCFLDAYPELFA